MVFVYKRPQQYIFGKNHAQLSSLSDKYFYKQLQYRDKQFKKIINKSNSTSFANERAQLTSKLVFKRLEDQFKKKINLKY